MSEDFDVFRQLGEQLVKISDLQSQLAEQVERIQKAVNKNACAINALMESHPQPDQVKARYKELLAQHKASRSESAPDE